MWGPYKYIVVKTDGENAQEHPFMFPSSVNHDGMMEGIRTAFLSDSWTTCNLVSAGFFDFETRKCSGRSETLNCASRGKTDEKLFADFLPKI